MSQGQWKIRLRRSRSSNLFQGPRTRWVRMHWMRQVVGKYLCDVTSDWMRLTVPQRSVFYVKLDPYYIACCTMCLTQFIEYCEDTQYIPIPPRKPGKQSARPTNHHYSNLSVWGFSAAGCCRSCGNTLNVTIKNTFPHLLGPSSRVLISSAASNDVRRDAAGIRRPVRENYCRGPPAIGRFGPRAPKVTKHPTQPGLPNNLPC